ncbi:MAG: PaaX family transcriptional regulator C-terminal domain-containing protein [Pseudomonadota bacterium]
MRSDGYSSAITALSALGPLRVWSLLVTVFGDLAPRQPVDGPTLSTIMDGIGIKPEATRVALHRLRADDWIISDRQGRTSLHRLSDKGRRDSDAARPHIYGPVPKDRPARFVLLPEGQEPLHPTAMMEVAPRLYACGPETPTPRAMVLETGCVPHWARTALEPAPLLEGYTALHTVLQQVPTTVPNALQRAVLRVLIVHAWRRLCLRHPVLPRHMHSDDWRGHECRALVHDLLDRLDRPSLDAIKPN